MSLSCMHAQYSQNLLPLLVCSRFDKSEEEDQGMERWTY